MSTQELLERLLVEVLVVKKMVLDNSDKTNPIESSKDVLSVDECARLIGMKKSTIYKLTHERRIPFYKPNGNRLYFNRAEVMRWLQSNRTASDTEIDQAASQHLVSSLARRRGGGRNC